MILKIYLNISKSSNESMFPPHLNFAYLKREVSITTVLTARGLIINFIHRGNQLYGPCPVHGGDNPRAFVVSLSKNLWHCFTGCNAGGDVIQLVRCLDKNTYSQTAKYLASLVGSTPTSRIYQFNSTPREIFKPFTKHLPLDHRIPWLQKKGINRHTATTFDVGAYFGYGFLNGCIGVRLHDIRGEPVGYAGRRLDQHQATKLGKWKFPRGLPKNSLLYNFHRVKFNLQKGLVVVECPWGVMRLAQLDIPAVALLGINLSSIQHNMLSRVPQIILMLDGDNAGKIATTRLRLILSEKTKVHQVNLPLNNDPDDLSDELLTKLVGYFFL